MKNEATKRAIFLVVTNGGYKNSLKNEHNLACMIIDFLNHMVH
jgi:hypothetical protein